MNEEKYEVEIIDVRPINVERAPGDFLRVFRIIYYHPLVGYRAIWIDEDRFSEENLKRAIRADIEQELAKVRGRMKV